MFQAFILGISLIFLWVSPLKSQPRKYYYRADQEIVLEGIILQAEAKQRYRGRSRFLILEIRDETHPGTYTVELCPEWFLDWDFQSGQPVKIMGALTRMRRESRHVIARKIIYQDRTRELRDKHGFPNWRRGRRRRGPG